MGALRHPKLAVGHANEGKGNISLEKKCDKRKIIICDIGIDLGKYRVDNNLSDYLDD